MSTITEVREPELNELPKPSPGVPPPVPEQMAQRPMFADSLLEVDSAEKGRRKWSAVTSIVLQCLVIGVMLAVPLMFTDALPKQQLLTFLVAPPPPPAPPPPAATAPAVQVVRQVQTDLMDGQLRMPTRIPKKIEMIKEDAAPPPLMSGEGVVGGVVGGIPGGQVGGVIGGIVNSTSHLPSLPKLVVPVPKRIRVSQGVIAGMLIHKVEPIYPPLAKSARVQGNVILSAVISKEGTIQNLHVVSGHPMLIPAALEAVQQWRYRPFLVTGEPVEVEAQVTVTFQFSN